MPSMQKRRNAGKMQENAGKCRKWDGKMFLNEGEEIPLQSQIWQQAEFIMEQVPEVSRESNSRTIAKFQLDFNLLRSCSTHSDIRLQGPPFCRNKINPRNWPDITRRKVNLVDPLSTKNGTSVTLIPDDPASILGPYILNTL